MEIRPTSAGHATPVPGACDPNDDATRPIGRVLLGDAVEPPPLPPLADLVSAVIALANGRQRKVLLPLDGRPAELALVRRGESIVVSYYETGGAPSVWLLDRRVPLRVLLEACAEGARRRALGGGSRTEREVSLKLAERIDGLEPARDEARLPAEVRRRGGAVTDPGSHVPLAFGFDARIVPCPLSSSDSSARADLHALLFTGSLWAWIRGRRIQLARGPIVLAAQRMIAAVRALVDAAEAGRPANVRLRAGGFQVGVRLDRQSSVALSLGSDGDSRVTVPALDVGEAALPILRLGSDLLRALVAADRSQARNLRVRGLREEVRSLRRRIRDRERTDGFVNRDPDRLRASTPPMRVDPPRSAASPSPGKLRFTERWSAAVEELDAASTFFCGDRLVVATARRAVALCRDSGDVLWVREGTGGTAWMAGTSLLRLSPDGEVELCDVGDGEPYATTRVSPRIGTPLVVGAGGRGIPPMAIVAEAENRLVALDLRNGEPRWRYATRTGGAFRIGRVGRLLLVACGDAAIDAVDVTTGEVVWRFSDRTRFCFTPAVSGDVVVAAGGEPGGRVGALYGIDLYSGALLWQRRMDAAPASAPLAAGPVVAVSVGGSRRGSLAAVVPSDGSLAWMVPDPGMGTGGACMALDRSLVVNAPAGHVTSVDVDTGQTRWSRRLSDPVADDVPRRLEPVLRGGALFVPAASVHVLRPSDGASLGVALPCDLVPDLIRVDERGWAYVAEESGHMAAYAPGPHLALVK